MIKMVGGVKKSQNDELWNAMDKYPVASDGMQSMEIHAKMLMPEIEKTPELTCNHID